MQIIIILNIEMFLCFIYHLITLSTYLNILNNQNIYSSSSLAQLLHSQYSIIWFYGSVFKISRVLSSSD